MLKLLLLSLKCTVSSRCKVFSEHPSMKLQVQFVSTDMKTGERHTKPTCFCAGWCECLFLPSSLSAGGIRCGGAAFWAKEHPGDAELPWVSSWGRKGAGTSWAKPWGVKAEGNICGFQSLPSTRHWLAWGTHKWDLLPTASHLSPVSDPEPSPCVPLAGDLETASHTSAFAHPRKRLVSGPFHSSVSSTIAKKHLGFPLPSEDPASAITGAGRSRDCVTDLLSWIWPHKCWQTPISN